MIEIDLDNPLYLLSTAQHAKDYKFYLVMPKPNYTAEALKANPNCVAAADLLFKSTLIPDDKGTAQVDLKPKAKEIQDKLKEPQTDVHGFVVATAKRKLADRECTMTPFRLKKPGSIELKALVGTFSPQNWVTYHHPVWFVEMVVKGAIQEIQILYSLQQGSPPMHAMWEQTAPGQLKAGRVVFGGLEPHAPNAQCKLPDVPHTSGWWGSCGYIWSSPFTVKLLTGVQRYIIGAYPRALGNEVLTVQGTGPFASVRKQIELVQNGAHPHPGD